MTTRAAIVIMANTANALTTAYEFKEAGDEVIVVFTGASTRWIGKLSDPEHRLHRAFTLVEDEVVGAPLLTEYRGHQSLRRLTNEGYQIITF